MSEFSYGPDESGGPELPPGYWLEPIRFAPIRRPELNDPNNVPDDGEEGHTEFDFGPSHETQEMDLFLPRDELDWSPTDAADLYDEVPDSDGDEPLDRSATNEPSVDDEPEDVLAPAEAASERTPADESERWKAEEFGELRATPLCDYADGLGKSAQLTQAAGAYACVERSDEGDGAYDGLEQVEELRAKAGTYGAKGRAARRAGQFPAATASFRAALAIDRSDHGGCEPARDCHHRRPAGGRR